MTEAKKYASVKRVSLAGLSEAWDDSCFAYVVPCNFKQRLASMELEKDEYTDDQRLDFQTKLVTEHFVSGRIKMFNGSDFEEADLTAEIAIEIPDVSNKLALFVLGYDVDPKDISAALLKSESPTNDEKATETPSSEDSLSPTSSPSS
jgi:hypothetical protein